MENSLLKFSLRKFWGQLLGIKLHPLWGGTPYPLQVGANCFPYVSFSTLFFQKRENLIIQHIEIIHCMSPINRNEKLNYPEDITQTIHTQALLFDPWGCTCDHTCVINTRATARHGNTVCFQEDETSKTQSRDMSLCVLSKPHEPRAHEA